MIRLNDSGDLLEVLRSTRIENRQSVQRTLATAAELKAALAEAGLAIVPVEPSDAMINAGTAQGERKQYRGWSQWEYKHPLFVYRAMLQAALKEAE